MILLDGNALAKIKKEELAEQTAALRSTGKKVPHLAAILVGNNAASEAYVRNKVRSCEQVGFHSTLLRLPDTITQAELFAEIRRLNDDDTIDGFIVQLPLPKHIDEQAVLLSIAPHKDVDGFHPTNFGRMAQGLPAYLPATPSGILQILEHYHIDIQGKHCVIVGRSNIVGTPISILLSRKNRYGNATVTLTHSHTKDIAEQTRRADILIAAIGIPHFIKKEMISEGAVVIDVGINRIEDVSHPKGARLVGDVDYDQVAPLCSAITPVPGGVGPMTVVALLQNTFDAATQKIYL
jgi:methenyltetrahydrofolate cyclohydrolase (EC 3.5.4.9)/5,10-methylenetetrahydrofolate dehydrogenase (NADP+) (EC 1.5.1.5)